MSQRIESAAASITIWGSLAAWFANALDWLSRNPATVTSITLIIGLLVQCLASRRNNKLVEENNRRAEEEHQVKMKILLGELPDRRREPRDGD